MSDGNKIKFNLSINTNQIVRRVEETRKKKKNIDDNRMEFFHISIYLAIIIKRSFNKPLCNDTDHHRTANGKWKTTGYLLHSHSHFGHFNSTHFKSTVSLSLFLFLFLFHTIQQIKSLLVSKNFHYFNCVDKCNNELLPLKMKRLQCNEVDLYWAKLTNLIS